MLKKLGCKFIITNTSKIGYDAGYGASKMQIFIGKFKDRQLKKLQKKIKKTRKQNGNIERSNYTTRRKWFFQKIKSTENQNVLFL